MKDAFLENLARHPTLKFDLMHKENPVKLQDACRELGVGKTYLCAIKKHLEIRGRFVFLSVIRKFMLTHPEFRSRQVYASKKQCAQCGKQFASSNAIEIKMRGERFVCCGAECGSNLLLSLSLEISPTRSNNHRGRQSVTADMHGG